MVLDATSQMVCPLCLTEASMLNTPAIYGRIREFATAHRTLDAFMKAHVQERKADVHSGATAKDDVFSMLVRANEEDGSKFPLDDSELVRSRPNTHLVYLISPHFVDRKRFHIVSCWTRYGSIIYVF